MNGMPGAVVDKGVISWCRGSSKSPRQESLGSFELWLKSNRNSSSARSFQSNSALAAHKQKFVAVLRYIALMEDARRNDISARSKGGKEDQGVGDDAEESECPASDADSGEKKGRSQKAGNKKAGRKSGGNLSPGDAGTTENLSFVKDYKTEEDWKNPFLKKRYEKCTRNGAQIPTEINAVAEENNCQPDSASEVDAETSSENALEDYGRYKVNVLKDKLRERKLMVSGNKDDLVNRLIDNDEQNRAAKSPSTAPGSNKDGDARNKTKRDSTGLAASQYKVLATSDEFFGARKMVGQSNHYRLPFVLHGTEVMGKTSRPAAKSDQTKIDNPSQKKPSEPAAMSDETKIDSSSHPLDESVTWIHIKRPQDRPIPEIPLNAGFVETDEWKSEKSDNYLQYIDILCLQKSQNVEPCTSNRAEANTTQGGDPGDECEKDHTLALMKAYVDDYNLFVAGEMFEELYQSLFDWQHDSCDETGELMMGFGNVRMVNSSSGQIANGPLLLVSVEVKLDSGSIMVKPRVHSEIKVEGEVLSILMLGEGNKSRNPSLVEKLYQFVAEQKPLQLSPGSSETYSTFLKELATRMSASGEVKKRTDPSLNKPPPFDTMIFSESWCLFSRPRTSAPLSRDATSGADSLVEGRVDASAAALAMTRFGQETHGETWRQNMLNKIYSLRLLSPPPEPILLFPNVASSDQLKIATMLFVQDCPAVVVQGGPGTGKTHATVNVLCAGLGLGKRFLATSKNAPALRVIWERIPEDFRRLCVDVSTIEDDGMKQMQRSIFCFSMAMEEALANQSKYSIEIKTCQNDVSLMKAELFKIEETIASASVRKRRLVKTLEEGDVLLELLAHLEETPWIAAAAVNWSTEQLQNLCSDIESLCHQQQKCSKSSVSFQFEEEPSEELLRAVSIKAGNNWLGPISNLRSSLTAKSAQRARTAAEQRDSILVDGKKPDSLEKWGIVLQALRLRKDLSTFSKTYGEKLLRLGWPREELYEPSLEGNCAQKIAKGASGRLRTILASKLCKLDHKTKMDVLQEIELSSGMSLDDRRRDLLAAIQEKEADLGFKMALFEASKRFTTERSRGHLNRLLRLVSDMKINTGDQSTMTDKQRRHYNDCMTALNDCAPFIPCLLMTTKQVSLLGVEQTFDYGVLEEASQSECPVLTAMARCNQWLILGDPQQVGPTQQFAKDKLLNSLSMMIPDMPPQMKSLYLPGKPFFDLCEAAFPGFCVRLRLQHRSTTEAMSFSNRHFYGGELISMRRPTIKGTALMDIFVSDGKRDAKRKTNEQECNAIVDHIDEAISSAEGPRQSIAIVSLGGPEQSKLIRKSLQERLGTQKFMAHDIIVGEPSNLQGAGRDVVYVSMVYCPDYVYPENAPERAKLANVAFSRARDRYVLFRSIGIQDVKDGDIKSEIIKHFAGEYSSEPERTTLKKRKKAPSSVKARASACLETLLTKHGFDVEDMGDVWRDAFWVGNTGIDIGTTIAVCIDNAGESEEAWKAMIARQKDMEGAGWTCFRIDALSMLLDYNATIASLLKCLADAGIKRSMNRSDDVLEVDDSNEEVVQYETDRVDVDLSQEGTGMENITTTNDNTGKNEQVSAALSGFQSVLKEFVQVLERNTVDGNNPRTNEASLMADSETAIGSQNNKRPRDDALSGTARHPRLEEVGTAAPEKPAPSRAGDGDMMGDDEESTEKTTGSIGGKRSLVLSEQDAISKHRKLSP